MAYTGSYWHFVHGTAVKLQRHLAKRDVAQFADGLLFSRFPLPFNTFVSFRVRSGACGWKGGLALGVTTREPSSLVDSQSHSEDNNRLARSSILIGANADLWLRPLPPLPEEVKLSLYLSYEGLLEVYMDGVLSSEILISQLPVTWPLWLMLDLYGATNEVEYLSLCDPSSGPGDGESSARKDLDIVPSKHIRIFLIGPSGSGKTALKNAIMNSWSGVSEEVEAPCPLAITSAFASRSSATAEWHYSTTRATKLTSERELLASFAYNVYREVTATSSTGLLNKETYTAAAQARLSHYFSGSLRPRKRECEPEVDQEAGQEDEREKSEMRSKLERLIGEIWEARQSAAVPTAASAGGSLEANLSLSRRKSSVDCVQCFTANIYEFSADQLAFLLHQVVLSSHAIYILTIDISKKLGELIDDKVTKGAEAAAAAATEGESGSEHERRHLETEATSGIRCLTDWWLNGIHTLVGRSFADRVDEAIALPRILLVGTHRNQVHLEPLTRDQVVSETFASIRAELAKCELDKYIHSEFVAVDLKEMSVDEPRVLNKIKSTIQRIAQEQKLLPMAVPIQWVLLEQSLDRLRARGIQFAELSQLHELARSQCGQQFESRESFVDAIQFHHNRGNVVCFTGHFQTYHPTMGTFGGGNAVDEGGSICESGVVVLSPHWFYRNIYRLLDVVKLDRTAHVKSGIIPEGLLDEIWNSVQNKVIFTSFLNKLDVMCELEPYILPAGAEVDASQLHLASSPFAKVYFCPWLAEHNTPTSGEFEGDSSSGQQSSSATDEKRGDQADDEDRYYAEQEGRWRDRILEFHATFASVIPKGFYSRLIVRLARWSWTQGMARKPEMNGNKASIAIDFDHQLVMSCSVAERRLSFWIWKMMEESDELCPNPSIAVRARHLIESEMEHLKNNYYRRANYRLSVRCPCDLVCAAHGTGACSRPECAHFLSLSECLMRKIVECDYRQVRTNFIQKFFPQASYSEGVMLMSVGGGGLVPASASVAAPSTLGGGGILLEDQALGAVYEFVNGWETMFPLEPTWIGEAGKLLAGNAPGRDWVALAKRLGYSEKDTNRFLDETQPSGSLLKDWYETNGRTRYSVDVLISCLKMISRLDVINAIEFEMEPEATAPPVFISYQTDSQEAVLKLRRRLEMTGFPCWMDVGLMGAGDALYAKIYDGISRSRVMVCCLTPRFAASPMCAREVILADVLHKPILPIMLEPTPWPPPGPLAVILSSLVYVDLCNVGSHGGSGVHVDNETRFRDVIERISRYVTGFVDMPCMVTRRIPDLFSPHRAPSIGRAASLRSLSRQISLQDRHSISQTVVHDTSGNEVESGSSGGGVVASGSVSGPVDAAFQPDDLMLDESDPVQQINRVANCAVCIIL